MKTEIEKKFAWGFVLDEQELRRILKTCKDHIAKLNFPSEESENLIIVKLRDGSLIETENLEDVFEIENDGSKSIEKITIQFNDRKDDPSWQLVVKLQDGKRNPESWTSIYYKIVGESRDWVFLAAAEIDERLKKIKIISWPYVASKEWISVAFMLGIMLFMISSMFLFQERINVNHGVILEQAYQKQEIKNAIEAIILVEKSRAKVGIGSILLPMLGSASIPFCLFLLVSLILPHFSLTYNFYWGEYKSIFDKRKNRLTVFWIAIVLGVIASIIGGLVLRYV